MALGTITVLDGTGTPISVQVLSPSPFTWAHVLVDGVAGVNVAAVTAENALKVADTPTASAATGIIPVVSTSLETGHVIKAAAGNLYGFEVTTTSASGIVLVFNSTTVPAAGAVTPIASYQVAANST